MKCFYPDTCRKVFSISCRLDWSLQSSSRSAGTFIIYTINVDVDFNDMFFFPFVLQTYAVQSHYGIPHSEVIKKNQ